jgi:1-deoxy-D-xylulose-5-phosphate reductoisomerase
MNDEMKNIVILGSTGSIGRSALSVISEHRDKFRVVGLTANTNHDLLLEQIREFAPLTVAVSDAGTAALVRKHAGVHVLEGEEGLVSVASHEEADFVISAIVGYAGLAPTLSAVRAGKDIGLANKETLVVAGEVVMEEARQSGSGIFPVDSEHSAIFQCLRGHEMAHLRKIVLTASGGPFVGRSADELRDVTPEEALRHPSWSMGSKITIDSATLMNKGLEVIEAHHLFGVEPGRIEVLVHPQSIIHSMVEFVDGSSIAQLSLPDMRGAIAYAMSYPGRIDGVVPSLDLASQGTLTFGRPDTESFPCLAFAYEALREGGTVPAVLNAANEVAVEAFLARSIRFGHIPVIIEKTMHSHKKERADSLETVIWAHTWAHGHATELLDTITVT